MAGRKSKNTEVLIGKLANLLTIDEWFDKFEFSKTTGIIVGSCNPRLQLLVNGGYLESKQGPARKLLYRMTVEMRLMMIERGQRNKAAKGNPKERINKGSKIMIVAETEARKEAAERMLCSINFI